MDDTLWIPAFAGKTVNVFMSFVKFFVGFVVKIN